MKVCWFSTGASSFMACYLTKDIDKIIYIHIPDQHPDSLRFLRDCEEKLGRKIEIIQSMEYSGVNDVINKTKCVNTPFGAPCTTKLKKDVRKKWESEHPGHHTYVWGFDSNELDRANRLEKAMSDYDHEFPLIRYGLTKEKVHKFVSNLGIKRPKMYELGFQNNNCIGCVKGGMYYWNLIRKHFPDVFEERARLERKIGHSCIKGVFLDELDPERGRPQDEINNECGISCELNLDRLKESLRLL